MDNDRAKRALIGAVRAILRPLVGRLAAGGITANQVTVAAALGLGTGGVFKRVAEWFPDRVGTVTGVVGAAGVAAQPTFTPLWCGQSRIGSPVAGWVRIAGGCRGRICGQPDGTG